MNREFSLRTGQRAPVTSNATTYGGLLRLSRPVEHSALPRSDHCSAFRS